MKQQTEINPLVEAINGISRVRDYDLNILETAQRTNDIAFWAIIISVGVALITIIATIYIFRRQENIIKDQLEVSNQQNKIALFDKRYTSYKSYHIFMQNAHNALGGIENDLSYKGEIKWREFFNSLIFVEGKKRDFKSRIILRSGMKDFTFNLEKIKYLFDFDRAELSNLDDIISKFKDLCDAVRGDDDGHDNPAYEHACEYEILPEKLTKLLNLIVESTFYETMEKQLNLKSSI